MLGLAIRLTDLRGYPLLCGCVDSPGHHVPQHQVAVHWSLEEEATAMCT